MATTEGQRGPALDTTSESDMRSPIDDIGHAASLAEGYDAVRGLSRLSTSVELLRDGEHVAVHLYSIGRLRVAFKNYTVEGAIKAHHQIQNEVSASIRCDRDSPLLNTPVAQLSAGQQQGLASVGVGLNAAHAAYEWAEENKEDGTREEVMEEFGRRFAACGLLALESIHGRGMVMCDVKPDNVLEVPGLKLFQFNDLGGCVPEDDSNAVPAVTLGMLSPEEAAVPEALLGCAMLPVSKTSDIYKLGQSLGFIMVGTLPDELAWQEPPPGTLRDEVVRAYCRSVVDWAANGKWGPWLEEHLEDADLRDLLLGLLASEPSARLTIEQAKGKAWVAEDVREVEEIVARSRPLWVERRAAVLQLLSMGPAAGEEVLPAVAAAAQQQLVKQLEEQQQQLDAQQQQLEWQQDLLTQLAQELQHVKQQQVAAEAADSGGHSRCAMVDAEAMTDTVAGPSKGSNAGAWGAGEGGPGVWERVVSPRTPPEPLSRAASAPLPGTRGLTPCRSSDSSEWARSGGTSPSGGGVERGDRSDRNISSSVSQGDASATADSVAAALSGAAGGALATCSSHSDGDVTHSSATDTCSRDTVGSGQAAVGRVQQSTNSTEVLSSPITAPSQVVSGSCGDSAALGAAATGPVSVGSDAVEATAAVRGLAPAAGAAANSSARLTEISSSSINSKSSRRNSSSGGVSACIKPGGGGEVPAVSVPPGQAAPPDAEHFLDDAFMYGLVGQEQVAGLPPPPPLPLSSPMAAPVASPAAPQQQHMEARAAKKAKSKGEGACKKLLDRARAWGKEKWRKCCESPCFGGSKPQVLYDD